MPDLAFKHIVSSSDSIDAFPASNLLFPQPRCWKGKAGSVSNSVVLQLIKEDHIKSIDIGNASSAFIEVLVAKSCDSPPLFVPLIECQTFMDPGESANERNGSRVKMFSTNHFTQTVALKKWDLVKVVCKQPFNKRIPYGIYFIRVVGGDENESAAPVSTASTSKGTTPSSKGQAANYFDMLEEQIHDQRRAEASSHEALARNKENHRRQMEAMVIKAREARERKRKASARDDFSDDDFDDDLTIDSSNRGSPKVTSFSEPRPSNSARTSERDGSRTTCRRVLGSSSKHSLKNSRLRREFGSESSDDISIIDEVREEQERIKAKARLAISTGSSTSASNSSSKASTMLSKSPSRAAATILLDSRAKPRGGDFHASLAATPKTAVIKYPRFPQTSNSGAKNQQTVTKTPPSGGKTNNTVTGTVTPKRSTLLTRMAEELQRSANRSPSKARSSLLNKLRMPASQVVPHDEDNLYVTPTSSQSHLTLLDDSSPRDCGSTSDLTQADTFSPLTPISSSASSSSICGVRNVTPTKTAKVVTPTAVASSSRQLTKKVESSSTSAARDTTTTSSSIRTPKNRVCEVVVLPLAGVRFSLSGFLNPQRSQMRDKGIALGASYVNDLDPTVSHLVCAFKNTPKARKVANSVHVVSGMWLDRCSIEQRRLDERLFAFR